MRCGLSNFGPGREVSHSSPSNKNMIQVCRICFETGSKLNLMNGDINLNKEYETVIGFPMQQDEKLPPYLCSKCTNELVNSSRFRVKTLEAHSILLKIIDNQGYITLESIKSAIAKQNSSRIKNPTNCELNIKQENTEPDNQTDKNTSKFDVTVDGCKVEHVEHDVNNIFEEQSDNDEDSYREDFACPPDPTEEDDGRRRGNDEVAEKPVSVDNIETDNDEETNINFDGIDDEDTFMGNCSHLSRPETMFNTTEENETRNVIENENLNKEISHELMSDKLLSHNICNFETDGENNLSNQALTNDFQSYICDMCNFTTNHRKNIKHHIGRHYYAGKKSCSCNDCNKSFNKKQEMQYVVRIDASKKYFTCNICGKVFTHKSHVVRHLQMHAGIKPFSCSVCNKSFNQKCHYTRHMKVHSNDTPYNCDICNKKYKFKDTLKTHIISHTGRKVHNCDICNRSFTLKWQFTRHMLTHSDNNKTFSCNICNKTFVKKWHFNRHRRLHDNHDIKNILSCDICSKTFKYQDTYDCHMRKHNSEKPYACVVSKKGFRNLKKSDVQMQTQRPLDKLLQCDVCDKEFCHRNSLITHMKTHSGNIPYPCNICDKAFIVKRHLLRHIPTHSSEKPFTCDACHKSFKIKETLRSHLKTHFGEKPYSCDVCREKFEEKCEIQNHIRKHFSVNL